MDEKRIIEFVILYCRDELTASDATELDLWLKESERHRVLFTTYLERYRLARRVGFYDTMDERRAWSRLTRRIRYVGMGRKSRFTRYFPYVASFLLLVSVFSYTGYKYFGGDNVPNIVEPGSSKAVLQLSDGRTIPLSADSMISLTEVNGVVIEKGEEGGIRYLVAGGEVETVFNTIRVPRGGEYYLCLSDGTRIWLNSDSELTYPVSMVGSSRDVRLKGEAYFEVARDEVHPFRVACGDSRITVLGTKFNIMAYAGQRDVVTTLVDGSVQVTAGRDSLTLVPGEQSLSGVNGIHVKKVDANMCIAWISGIFEFENMTLRQITEQLGRWYDVTFVYTDPVLQDIMFTGAADRHRSLDIVLKMIEKLSGVYFETKGDVIVISKK